MWVVTVDECNFNTHTYYVRTHTNAITHINRTYKYSFNKNQQIPDCTRMTKWNVRNITS